MELVCKNSFNILPLCKSEKGKLDFAYFAISLARFFYDHWQNQSIGLTNQNAHSISVILRQINANQSVFVFSVCCCCCFGLFLFFSCFVLFCFRFVFVFFFFANFMVS